MYNPKGIASDDGHLKTIRALQILSCKLIFHTEKTRHDMKKRVRSSGGSTGGHGENERTESSNCKANAKEKAALSSHASVHCPEVNGDSDDDCSLAKKARMLPVQNAANMPCSGSPNDGVVDAEAVGRFAPDTDVPSCNDSVSAHDPYRPCPIILSMKLLNFMCHENLALDFGPHINFIVGQNGSGKSAVLTALMVCLGASASKTQRGHRLSSLIKQNARYSSEKRRKHKWPHCRSLCVAVYLCLPMLGHI